jgi:hypothetical protein
MWRPISCHPRGPHSIQKPFPLFLGFRIMSPTKEFFRDVAVFLLPSSSAPPLTGSYPAGILSLFERLKAVGHKLVAENFGLRAKPFSKDAKSPAQGRGLYSSESKLASVKLANRAIGRESSEAELVPRSLPVRPRTYETRASRHDHNEVCVIPGLSAQTVIGYNERRSRRQ